MGEGHRDAGGSYMLNGSPEQAKRAEYECDISPFRDKEWGRGF